MPAIRFDELTKARQTEVKDMLRNIKQRGIEKVRLSNELIQLIQDFADHSVEKCGVSEGVCNSHGFDESVAGRKCPFTRAKELLKNNA